jgi:hypothetical protein
MKKENRTRILKRIKVDVFPEPWLKAIDDLHRTGLKRVNPENEDSAFHCSAEWHFARFTGDGSSLAPLVYNIVFRIAGESGNFAASIAKVAKYLGVNKRYVFDAANLLVTAGFFEVIEAEQGKATQYRPVSHSDWAKKRPGYCTKKIEKLFPFMVQDEGTGSKGRRKRFQDYLRAKFTREPCT